MFMGIKGANLKIPDQTKAFQLWAKFLGLKCEGTVSLGKQSSTKDTDTTRPRNIHFLVKTSATAPTTNTAADAPTGVGDICIHQLSTHIVQGVYNCTAFTSTSVFTWTQTA
jgi:hypothetical protein